MDLLKDLREEEADILRLRAESSGERFQRLTDALMECRWKINQIVPDSVPTLAVALDELRERWREVSWLRDVIEG